jgi:hypothetical protein
VAGLLRELDAPGWQVLMELDALLTRIAEGADARLGFQSAYPAGRA